MEDNGWKQVLNQLSNLKIKLSPSLTLWLPTMGDFKYIFSASVYCTKCPLSIGVLFFGEKNQKMHWIETWLKKPVGSKNEWHHHKYTSLAVVSCARKTLRVSTIAIGSANSGCFVERGRCARHAKILSVSLTSDT
jgi:hypothetical protein